MKNYEAILNALTRSCPTCGSASGQPCLTNTMKNSAGKILATLDSKPCRPHASRMKGI